MTALGEPWFLVTAPVCRTHELDPRVALEHNARTAVGHLALEGGRFVLRHTAPLAGLGLADVERIVEIVACDAAALARVARGRHHRLQPLPGVTDRCGTRSGAPPRSWARACLTP